MRSRLPSVWQTHKEAEMANDYSNDMFFAVDAKGRVEKGPFGLPRAHDGTSGIWNLSEQELADKFRLFKQVRGVIPDYDEATQIVEGPTRAVDGITVVESYTVRDLTVQEIADRQAVEDAVEEAEIERLVDDRYGRLFFWIVNQIRDLQGQQPLTRAQFKNRFKQVVSQ
jgi:hypothetical protein